MSDRNWVMAAQPLVSVIVPIYKVEPYLAECVDSLCRQTYQNLEIILVDDGSPDRCGQMCDDFAAGDNRITVIHKKNGGLSDARNTGMAHASGDYLCFVDSDDYLALNAISVLLETALEHDADIVCGIHQSFYDGETVAVEDHEPQVEILDSLTAIKRSVRKDWGAWGKLYKRSVHESILFPVGKIHEDEAIMLQLLQKCRRVVFLDSKLYFYRTRENSITSTPYSLKKMDWMDGWIANVETAKHYDWEVYLLCLNKALTVALYNIGHLLTDTRSDAHISVIWEFTKRYFKDLIRNPYTSRNAKTRLIIFRMSNLKRKNCLYTNVYGLLDKFRKRAQR